MTLPNEKAAGMTVGTRLAPVVIVFVIAFGIFLALKDAYDAFSAVN